MAQAPAPMKPARLETLADGLFAIAMTLLVIELHAPAETLATSEELVHSLVEILPEVLTFALSFLVMAVYWIGHHYQFHNFRRVDRPFLWINMVFLLLIALLPFTTAVLGRQYVHQPAIVLYGVHLILIGLAFLAVLRYATHRNRLVDADYDHRITTFATRRILIAPAFALVAILVSFWSPHVAYFVFMLALVPPVFPSMVDRLIGARR